MSIPELKPGQIWLTRAQTKRYTIQSVRVRENFEETGCVEFNGFASMLGMDGEIDITGATRYRYVGNGECWYSYRHRDDPHDFVTLLWSPP